VDEHFEALRRHESEVAGAGAPGPFGREHRLRPAPAVKALTVPTEVWTKPFLIAIFQRGVRHRGILGSARPGEETERSFRWLWCCASRHGGVGRAANTQGRSTMSVIGSVAEIILAVTGLLNTIPRLHRWWVWRRRPSTAEQLGQIDQPD
jgi:hypothetical protein